MTRRSTLLLFAVVIGAFLTGCSLFNKDSAPSVYRIGEHYKAVNALTMHVAISADFPEHMSEYKVKYAHNKESNDIIEIIEPEEVSGVKISVQQGKTEIVFDGARLETGAVDNAGLTPLNAIPKLIEQWSNGKVTESCVDSRNGVDTIMIVHEDDTEKLEYRTWFNISDYTPVYSEIFADGKSAICCEYEMLSTN